ncbi:putative coiled-coil domain-containing protein mtmr15 protein [Phaeoacremonium minimum UCRPA7]|uniref:Fanconi-associated nuclease n=1 Tax=Phaeoacremonium minimum (strain UCR-PA7) TaxID=1286976 RepID=R8BM90_PHAM7|nr:putative coiled-coil domain-containing protein mtmr15 protein [Phaeoacremonium minimum UCRPA7]EOO00474.1 putative coiled-coil domain-containing protein mtmr15 protein [Phaeoacremonium minimum UCRPA7]
MHHPANRPLKKVKVEHSRDSSEDESSVKSFQADLRPTHLNADEELRSETEDDGDHPSSSSVRRTEFEDALPPVATDKDAIEEYEAMRASQRSAAEEGEDTTAASNFDRRQWIRGKSSIYVDAFNLALDTVLEDEAHLFDTKEMNVFEAWRSLDYESQYLYVEKLTSYIRLLLKYPRYVRLFLRKTAAWHRSDRLGYYSDITDPEAAIEALQEKRNFAKEIHEEYTSGSGEVAGVALQDWSLGESFTFADSSEEFITSVKEAASLLSLDELKTLAKEAKVQGKNKADIIKKLCQMSSQQIGLVSLGLRRESTSGSTDSKDGERNDSQTPDPATNYNRNAHFLGKMLAITGPCIRLSPPVFKLFERVHLVFYRSTEWTEKSLTTIILAKISRRNFPQYIVDRTSNIFPSRQSLLEFEQAMRLEFEVDQILEFNGPPGEVGFRRVLEIFNSLSTKWRELLREELHKEERIYEFGEGGYLRRLNPAHAYTRIAHKAAHVLGRLHEYQQEHALLTELLDQRLFQMARRGSWYQRKALLEEHYMFEVDPNPRSADPEQQKKHWRRIAVSTCETALEDRDCHLIYHYDLQKRLTKLERKLKIPKRLQHDFGHVRLHAPEEHNVHGIQLKRDDPTAGKRGGTSTKTIWEDEAEGGGECSVEAMCLSHYRSEGWKGYHSEGGIVRTLFAYLFYDILFLYIPNVFQTAYQTCPLDLHTDAFYPTRASEINHRLVEIANGGAEQILRNVDTQHRERRTCIVGLNWDYELDDLLELVRCFRGEALAAICKVMAQEYGQRGGGIPDLVLWRTEPQPECMFAEVKSANDRLSDTQRLWIHVLTGAGVRVALVNAIAKEVKEVD